MEHLHTCIIKKELNEVIEISGVPVKLDAVKVERYTEIPRVPAHVNNLKQLGNMLTVVRWFQFHWTVKFAFWEILLIIVRKYLEQIYRFYEIEKARTTLSQDVQTWFSVQLAFANSYLKYKKIFNTVPVSWMQHFLRNFTLF